MTGLLIVPQFHDVVEVACRIVATDVENIHEALVGARDRLEFKQPGEFPVERPGMLEGFAVNDLHGAKRLRHTSGQPHLAVTAAADAPQQFVIRDARQESAFNPRAVSSANALGLMQVLPGTGKQIAKKFGFPFDRNRMLSDAAYNAQMGAAELGDVLEAYRGSYILSFVAYNAGRGRGKQWIEKSGDPRDANVDPIDWVERIPFSETRNYVQRVLENMQVYRAQLGIGSRLMIEADLRRGSAAN